MNLVVGGAGFLGRSIVRLLREDGEDVRVLDLEPSTEPGVESIRADLCDRAALERACADVETVVHCASAFSQNPAARARLRRVNVEGTRALLEVCRAAGVRAFVYTSSVDVLFDGTPISGRPTSLEPVARPLGVYAQTKAVAESMVRAANDDDRTRTCAIRPAGIYGPHDRLRMPQVLGAARRGRFMRIGDGTSLYSHVYVDNVAWAHIFAARNLLERGDVAGHAYVVTDHEPENFYAFLLPFVRHAVGEVPLRSVSRGVAISLAWLIEAGYAVGGRVLAREPNLTRYTVGALSRDLWFTHERATDDFGYQPVVSLTDARAQTCRWLDALPT